MANGPRKELSFLDRALMNKAATQGGVLNFLGQQPQVTAPIKAQSHADSPPVQLAYITDAEKDLLVKSNIHGSLAGKPNPGPAGIPSLDDFFNTPGGGIGGGSTSNTGGSIGGGGSSGGGSSADDYGIGAGQAVGGSDSGTVFDSQGSGNNQTFVPVSDEEQKKAEEEAKKKLDASKPEPEEKKKDKKSLTDTIKSVFSMDELQQFTPLMLNTIQTELNKFIELGVKNPITLRSLMIGNIGGGIFGKDQTFSDMQGNVIDPESVSINDETGKIMGMNEDGELVDVRYTREGMQDLMKERFGDDVFEALKMSAPDIGYTALGGYMPQTSGGLVDLGNKAVAKKNPDGTYTTADGRTISKDQGEAFNRMVFDARMELDRMNKDRSGNPQGQPQGIPSLPGFKLPDAEAELPTPPNVYPLPPGIIPPFGRPPFGPPEGDKFDRPAPYNYYAQSPQYRFRGIPSVNTNEFNEQLRKLYGMA